MASPPSPPSSPPAPAAPAQPPAPLVVVMGVCGAGKSTAAALVGARLRLPGAQVRDGDDFHSAANKAKMGAGTPLDDGDRAPWLRDIGAFLGGARAGAVVSCSALKRRYREQLRAAAGAPVLFAHLTADEASISARLEARAAATGHYMKAGMLASQLQALEPLEADELGGGRGIVVDVTRLAPEAAADAIVAALAAGGAGAGGGQSGHGRGGGGGGGGGFSSSASLLLSLSLALVLLALQAAPAAPAPAFEHQPPQSLFSASSASSSFPFSSPEAAAPATASAASRRAHGLAEDPPDRPPPPELIFRIRGEAAQGSRDALYQLGLLQYFGLGVAADAPAAARSFREAATLGHPAAAANLGMILERGAAGVAADPAAAFAWYSAGAEGGERQGMLGAGRMLYENRVPRYEERERIADAFGLFERAVARQHPEAYYYLGVLYEYGAHRPQDFRKAAELYERGCSGAAEEARGVGAAAAGVGVGAGAALGLGDADACFNLGLLHAYGRGFEQDFGAAARILQACSHRHAHAGCSLYLGLLHAGGGPGLERVDYELARLYLQRAADAGDVRFAKEAHTAFSRLDGLVREAEARQAQVLAELQQGLRPPPPPPDRGVADLRAAEARMPAFEWADGASL